MKTNDNIKTRVAVTVLVMMLLFVAACLSSCRTTKVQVVERVRTDSIYITNLQRDSIYLHDSVYLAQKGDTIYHERWHTKYIERIQHDTIATAKVDSIPVPYEVEKIVRVKPPFLVWCTVFFWLIVAAAIIVIAVKTYLKFSRPL